MNVENERTSLHAEGTVSIAVGSVLIAIGVGLGAFASHALTGRLPSHSLSIFETGVYYQLLAAFGVIVSGMLQIVGILSTKASERLANCFLLAALLFSGSLYLLSTSSEDRWIGAVTPIGGLVHIGAWITLALLVLRPKRS